MKEKIKAVGLFSGGLDSNLAVLAVKRQGIDVTALRFGSPFSESDEGERYADYISKRFNIRLKTIKMGMEFLGIIRNPKYGYGAGMNPCIDCKIYMLKKAKKYAKEIGAKFIFTGEVLGQRPMSQQMKALKIIEKEAGLENKVLRPLCAKYFLKTEAERAGWIERDKLLGIKGRSRKQQMSLAEEFGITGYPLPAGGCLLTYKEYSNKVRDLFEHKRRVSLKDIKLLKVGRHFRFGKNKIIVGSNEVQNKELLELKYKTDYVFEVPNIGSPVTVLQGEKTHDAISVAAQLTARYSDADSKKVLVRYGTSKAVKGIVVAALTQKKIDELRV